MSLYSMVIFTLGTGVCLPYTEETYVSEHLTCTGPGKGLERGPHSFLLVIINSFLRGGLTCRNTGTIKTSGHWPD